MENYILIAGGIIFVIFLILKNREPETSSERFRKNAKVKKRHVGKVGMESFSRINVKPVEKEQLRKKDENLKPVTQDLRENEIKKLILANQCETKSITYEEIDEELLSEIINCLESGHTVEAIKKYRLSIGCTFEFAKDEIGRLKMEKGIMYHGKNNGEIW